MDLFDRKIIGWSYGKNITAELATQAVKNACLNIKDTEGVILHSDLGSQYTSEEFEANDVTVLWVTKHHSRLKMKLLQLKR